ncbi:hypothetical protein N9W89_00135 [Hellea sp.]|nr:hypothetical protein [Hellea sp.]
MSKLPTKLLCGVAATFALSCAANAAPVTGSVNVDNDFIVVLSVTDAAGNTTNSTVYKGAHASRWNRREDFKFEVPGDNTNKQCSINVIAWGDRAVSQGFAGIFRGPDGTIYTGGSGITAQATGIASSGWASTGGGPTPSQIDTIVAGSFQPNPFEIPGTVTGGTNPWGTIDYSSVMTGVPASSFQWIWPTSNQMTGQYSAFKMGCGSLVKQVPPPPPPLPDPIDVPGDHFQCYMLKKGDNIKDEALTIEDQFGKSEAVLGRPVMLCNPSTKVHNRKSYDIRNKKRHLVCYNYVKQQSPKSEELMINNQMGADKVVSTKRELFCVPSEKYHLDENGNVIQIEEKGDDRVRPRRYERPDGEKYRRRN